MRPTPSVLPGLLLGIGLGGFLDGIVLHQVLQWHHLLSDRPCCPADRLAGLEENTLADGLFHLGAWLLTLAGSLAAVRAWRRGRLAPPWRAHVGALLAGWGLFNLLDSANHFVFGLHHVRDDLGGPLGWDLGFLLFGLALIAGGLSLIGGRSGSVRARSPRFAPRREV